LGIAGLHSSVRFTKKGKECTSVCRGNPIEHFLIPYTGCQPSLPPKVGNDTARMPFALCDGIEAKQFFMGSRVKLATIKNAWRCVIQYGRRIDTERFDRFADLPKSWAGAFTEAMVDTPRAMCAFTDFAQHTDSG
jgi:hypothetical protein